MIVRYCKGIIPCQGRVGMKTHGNTTASNNSPFKTCFHLRVATMNASATQINSRFDWNTIKQIIDFGVLLHFRKQLQDFTSWFIMVYQQYHFCLLDPTSPTPFPTCQACNPRRGWSTRPQSTSAIGGCWGSSTAYSLVGGCYLLMAIRNPGKL